MNFDDTSVSMIVGARFTTIEAIEFLTEKGLITVSDEARDDYCWIQDILASYDNEHQDDLRCVGYDCECFGADCSLILGKEIPAILLDCYADGNYDYKEYDIDIVALFNETQELLGKNVKLFAGVTEWG